MRRTLLAASALTALSVTAHAQSLIAPGQGTVTDPSGTQWQIVPDGSILQTAPDGTQTWTPGGGGTAALTIVGSTVYGEDARTGKWLTLSGQWWTPSALPPASVAAQQIPMTPAPAAISAMASPVIQASTAAPATTSTCTTPTSPAGVATGGFHVAGGQIIGPDGKPFIAKGVNMGKTDTIPQMLASFPGLNFVRLSINDYSSAASLSGIIQTLTAKRIVVLVENHLSSDGTYYGSAVGTVFSGSQLQTELSWYADIARTNAGDPYVWTASRNEPPGPGAALAGEIQAVYAAVRQTGNTAPFLIDVIGAYDTTSMPANFAASMTNVGYDLHFYGWIVPGRSAVQSDVNAALQSLVANLQQFHSADGTVPVIVAEYGDSTSGTAMDGNGMQVVEAVIRSAATAPQYTSGSAAWHVGWMGSAGDSLNNPDGSLTAPYGQAVALGIGDDPTASPNASLPTAAAVASCATQQATGQSTTTVLAQASPASPAATGQPDPSSETAGDAALLQAAQADLQQAETNLGQASQIAAQSQNTANDQQTAALIAAANANLAAVQAAMQTGGNQ